MKLTSCLNRFVFTFSLGLVVCAFAMIPVLRAQDVGNSPRGTVASGDLPPSKQQMVQVMVELKDSPASVTYAAALQQAQAQYNQQRNYALQHPNLKTSQALLKNTTTS